MIYQWDTWGLFSAVALIAWLPLGLWFFRRQRPPRAALHTLIWGAMWLPEAAEFDFPLLPPLDKFAISALVALIGLRMTSARRVKVARVGRGYDWILLLSIVALAATVSNNGEALHYGSYTTIDIPAFAAYDGLSAAIRLLFNIGIPWWLGRAVLRGRRDLLDALEILVTAGLVYSVPILWELKMSPALHANLYGFNARYDWSQNIRQGGYRATVFMGHGLIVGFFMFLATAAAVTLRRAGQRTLHDIPMSAVCFFLAIMLIVCKAVAALLYGMIAYALIMWLKPKTTMRILLVLCALVALYPTSRMFGWFPTEGVLAAANILGPDRAQSMQFRFDNEDILLVKGSERLWFGWGGFGRDRVYDSWSAKDLVVQDGHWIAVFGQQGFIGYACYFTMMLWPVVQAWKRMRRVQAHPDRAMLVGLAVMVTFMAVNLLPNMELPNLHAFFAAGLAILSREIPYARAKELEAQQRAQAVVR